MEPKDHRKDNFKYIKQKQEQVKNRLEEEAKVKEPFKLKKYQNVQAKVNIKQEDNNRLAAI